MERVIPVGSKLPQPGARVSILVGEPIEVADLLEAGRQLGWPQERLYSAIAERVGGALHALKARLEGLPLSEVIYPTLPALHECSVLAWHALEH
jgi:hypothetical protein